MAPTANEALAGRVAIVTGASRGIGAACARRLASEGAAVALAARDRERLDTVAAEIRDAGGRALAVPTDVTEEGSVATLVERAVSEYGRLDCAVNSAGRSGGGQVELLELTAADLDGSLDVNLRGTFFAMRAQVAAMLETGDGGSIVNVSSGAGLRAGAPGLTPYVASKHALQGMTKVTALEYAARGIRVNALAPGPIDTEMLAFGDERAKEMAARSVPMQRVGQPEEVAAAALWLCSDESSFITGATIEIDGGQAARG